LYSKPESFTASSPTKEESAKSSSTSTVVPSDNPAYSKAVFYCSNTRNKVTFPFGYDPYSYEDYVVLTGRNVKNGTLDGKLVVSYNRSSKSLHHA
jgi:hypothetical protein